VSFDWGTTTDYGNTTTVQTMTGIGAFSYALDGLLTPGTTYHFRAKAVGDGTVYGDDLTFTTGSLADASAPTTPAVTDDGTTTTSTSQLHATWSATDAESGVGEYQYAIGTISGGTDILGWTPMGMNTEATKTGLTLTPGTKYFISVKARNGDGLWSEVGISNGITVAAQDMAVEDIPHAGGTVQTTDGRIAADFPANTAVGVLTVTMEDMEPPSDMSTLQGFKAGNTYFVIKITDASGNPVVTLSQPITITVKYSEADLDAAGGDPNRLVLAYWDDVAGEWEALKTSVDNANMTLSASTTHLSTWAVLAKTTSASTGLPVWVLVVIGLAAVLVMGSGTYVVAKKVAEHQRQR